MIAAGCGAALGALLRYFLTQLWKQRQIDWPLATLLINITGTLLLGLLTGHLTNGSSQMLFWGSGVLGGYTTFSTFNTEMISLLDEHRWGTFASYFILSYGGGILAAWLGLQF
jgi:CrcB protein